MSKGSDKPKETPEEIELANIGAERWNDYKQRYIPVENAAIGRVLSEIDDPSGRGEDMANASTQMAFSPVEEQATMGLTTRGARPGSGAFAGGVTGVGLDRVASSGQNQANAFGLQRRINVNNLQSLVDIGQRKAASGLAGLTDVADAASRQAIFDARASAAARAALGNAAGTAAGVGFGLYNSSPVYSATTPRGMGPNINTSAPQPGTGY